MPFDYVLPDFEVEAFIVGDGTVTEWVLHDVSCECWTEDEGA